MKFIETLKLAVAAIWAHKLRSALTLLGMIIGVAADGTMAIVGDINNVDVADGRYFTEMEDNTAARVAYIGADVANKLFPSSSAVGGDIDINGLSYRVVGVATAKGTVFGIPQDTFVTLPLRTFRQTFGPLVR